MQPRKILEVDDSKLAEIAERTGIPLARLNAARAGKVELSADELRLLARAKVIKKPFGN